MKHYFARFPAALATALILLSLAIRADAQTRPRIVHVFVALADNRHQGIVPVPPRLGNGQDSANNLYWGAAFGVKSYFKASTDWKTLSCGSAPKRIVLERCIFKHATGAPGYLVADAYDGARIREAVSDFLSSAAGIREESLSFVDGADKLTSQAAGGADLIAYLGHDAFMDFQVPKVSGKKAPTPRQFIVLACASRSFFRPYMQETGSEPLLWTTGLMAPEAYTLKAALEGWLAGESAQAIRDRAAVAYDKYQKCGLRAAQRLFASTW